MGLFSKKDKGDDDDKSARSALFGSRKGSGSPAASQNPYAAPPPPYQPSQSAPPSSQTSSYGSSASQNAPYGGSRQNTSGNANGGYGGYGGYGGGSPANQSTTIDRNRDALFGNRQQQAPAQPPRPDGYAQKSSSAAQTPSTGAGYGQPASGQGTAAAPGGSYATAGYGQPERQLTAEEEEEEDVEAVKQQIRFTKQESVSSTRNALRVAAQAEETGRRTLGNLGEQGEKLYNTEKNLDVAAQHGRMAEEKARELKTLNRSMFAVHVNNPLRSQSKAEAEEQKILERHQWDRDERERTRQAGFQSKAALGKALNDKAGKFSTQRGAASLAERNKYQFDADESDDEKEKEIDSNLNQINNISMRLKGLAVETGKEVDRQNKQIDKVMGKNDNLDDAIHLTHNRIKRIH